MDFSNALQASTVPHGQVLESMLGHVDFGVAYRAGHQELNARVAIKKGLCVELAVREGDLVRPVSTDAVERREYGLRRLHEVAKQLVQFRCGRAAATCLESLPANGTA